MQQSRPQTRSGTASRLYRDYGNSRPSSLPWASPVLSTRLSPVDNTQTQYPPAFMRSPEIPAGHHRPPLPMIPSVAPVWRSPTRPTHGSIIHPPRPSKSVANSPPSSVSTRPHRRPAPTPPATPAPNPRPRFRAPLSFPPAQNPPPSRDQTAPLRRLLYTPLRCIVCPHNPQQRHQDTTPARKEHRRCGQIARRQTNGSSDPSWLSVVSPTPAVRTASLRTRFRSQDNVPVWLTSFRHFSNRILPDPEPYVGPRINPYPLFPRPLLADGRGSLPVSALRPIPAPQNVCWLLH